MQRKPVFKIAFFATILLLAAAQLNAGPGDEPTVQQADVVQVTDNFKPSLALPTAERAHDVGDGITVTLRRSEPAGSEFQVVVRNGGDNVKTLDLALAAEGEAMMYASRVPRRQTVQLGKKRLWVRVHPGKSVTRTVTFKTKRDAVAVRLQLTADGHVIKDALVATAGGPEGLGNGPMLRNRAPAANLAELVAPSAD